MPMLVAAATCCQFPACRRGAEPPPIGGREKCVRLSPARRDCLNNDEFADASKLLAEYWSDWRVPLMRVYGMTRSL